MTFAKDMLPAAMNMRVLRQHMGILALASCFLFCDMARFWLHALPTTVLLTAERQSEEEEAPLCPFQNNLLEEEVKHHSNLPNYPPWATSDHTIFPSSHRVEDEDISSIAYLSVPVPPPDGC